MKHLLIFDAFWDVKKRKEESFQSGDQILLFPLTSNLDLSTRLKERLEVLGCHVQVLATAALINSAAQRIRDRYIEFIATLPQKIKVGNKNLKEFFAIDEVASSWWFSLVAEKNTFKTDFFTRLSQFDAIVRIVESENINQIFLGCQSGKLKSALQLYCRDKGREILLKCLKIHRFSSLRKQIKESSWLSWSKHIFHLCFCAIVFFIKCLKIRRLVRRHPIKQVVDNHLIFITAFPYFDVSLAKQGVYQDKLFPYLQKELDNNQKSALWAVFYVQNETVSFDEALRYASSFIQNGYQIFLLEQTLTFSKQIWCLWQLFRHGWRFLRVRSALRQQHVWGNYNFFPILEDDWYKSFLGPEGYQALLFYVMFQEFFKRFSGQKILYCCEMHAWEKALIFAKQKLKKNAPLFAYQHATVSRMLLNYFNTFDEIREKKRYDLPQPNKIICNGPIPYDYLLACGWPKTCLVMGEAIRYQGLRVRNPIFNRQKRTILVVFSISDEESAAILRASYEAFKEQSSVEVWLKPHPFLEMDKVFDIVGLDKNDCPFFIKEDPIEELLKLVLVVIVGESSVSVEALSFGCEVVVVNVPEWINMSPLAGINGYMIKNVYSALELRQTVNDILAKPIGEEEILEEAQKIINRFFYFSKDLQGPKAFLNLLDNKYETME